MKVARSSRVEGQFKQDAFGKSRKTDFSRGVLIQKINSFLNSMGINELEDVYEFIKFMKIK